MAISSCSACMSRSWSRRCSASARCSARRSRRWCSRRVGVIVYFGLIRDIMKGPMLAQILGTFGLALLLRYSVFWWFGANFLSLPENIVGGTFDIAGPAHSGLAPAGRRRRAAGDARAAPAADAHLARIENAGGGRGFHRGAVDGHPARHHAGDRLGDRRRRHRACRRADRDLLLHRRRPSARRWASSPSSRCRSAASAACRAR